MNNNNSSRDFQKGNNPKNQKGPRTNGQIRAEKVRLINENGEMVGVISSREALEMAQDVGLDLVEVSPNAEPPVCKIMDLGKFLYEEQKKKKEAKKHQKVVLLKEVKLRITTDKHDLEYRLKQCEGWFKDGDKVKFSIKFRGREFDHIDIGREKFKGIIEALASIAKVDSFPKMEGGQLIMILAPIGNK
jgi:translation initiation factor IF-3